MSAPAMLRTRTPPRLAVRCMGSADGARWDAFVERCPQASFFHLSGWARVIESGLRHRTYFLYAERGGEIEGVLPLAFVDSWLTERALVSSPACIEAGVAAATEDAAQALEAEALLIARHLRAQRLELRHSRERHPDWPTGRHYVRFTKPILADEDANLLAVPRKQRAVIRKGISAGLLARIDPSLDDFYALYCDNQRRHGSPALGRDYFELLREVFGARCEILRVDEPRGGALSAVLSFYFRDTVMPYYAGDVPAARDSHANDFKYWSLLRLGCQRGLTTFDYGRSRIGSGSFDFKKNWGCEASPLFYEYQLFRGQCPTHTPNNPTYRALTEVWKRLPASVTRRMGPHLVRHFL